MDERRRINFPAQPADKNLDQLHVVFVFPFPDAFAQFGAGKDPARFAHQDAEQGELARRTEAKRRDAVHYPPDRG